MLRIGRLVRGWTSQVVPWTNVYGVGRTLLALSTMSTLLFNSSATLFRPIAGVPGPVPYCSEVAQRLGPVCLARDHLEIGRWIMVTLLLVAASGWRPRIMGPIQWWISMGFQAAASTVDGGDQATAVLTLLLLPAALTDHRKWHWTACSEAEARGEGRRLIALSSLMMARLQVSAIYFHAAVGKMRVTEWADGTALYYWFHHPTFGANDFVMTLINPIITHSVTVTALTWSIVVLEFALTMGLFATRPVRHVLLPLGIAFHFGIIVIHGLSSFALVMFGALVVYLRPIDEVFDFGWVGSAGQRLLALLPAQSPERMNEGHVVERPVGS
jgi:antimicrobial peptide system SdpB family protein